jgi:hypothetical protein
MKSETSMHWRPVWHLALRARSQPELEDVGGSGLEPGRASFEPPAHASIYTHRISSLMSFYLIGQCCIPVYGRDFCWRPVRSGADFSNSSGAKLHTCRK